MCEFPSSSLFLSLRLLMCKSKMDTQVKQPKPKPKPSRDRTFRTPPTSTSSSQSSSSKPLPSTTTSSSSSSSQPPPSSSSTNNYNFSSTSSNYKDNYNSTASISSKNSLSSLKDSLPETPLIYDISEICTATNNFLSKRFSSSSSSSSCWRCTVRGKDVVVFQRKSRRSIEPSHLRERLSMIYRSHHISLIKLLGACVAGEFIYLVYNYVNGSNLSDCLRNPRNPEFTVLSSWISRMQIATDLAQGLEYIHHYTGLNLFLVHNHIKSSSVLVTEPSFNAKICHFGTSELCGEIYHDDKRFINGEIREEKDEESKKIKRSDSGRMKVSGTRGYMSPEYQSSGIATQKSDVYAFGVVILELLSGEEPVRVRYDRESGEYRRVSVIETAREAVTETEEEGIGGKIRRWVDRRLKDSFPVEVAEKITRLALDCVHVDEDKRPDMKRVAGKISRLYLQSKMWADKIRTPTEILSVSLAPR